MDIHFNKLTEEYKKVTIDIFNYYIEHTTAAYRSEKVDYDFFNALVDENTVSAYAVMNNSNDVIGFCMLEKYKNIGTFNEPTYCFFTFSFFHFASVHSSLYIYTIPMFLPNFRQQFFNLPYSINPCFL